MDVCDGIPELAQKSSHSWIPTFQTKLVQSTDSAWEERGLAKSSKLAKKTQENQQKTHKSSVKIWLENCICKALRWVLVSEKFDRRAGKLNFTYRKPLPGSNGGTESAEGKKTTPQTPEAIRIQGETQEPRRYLWWCWSVEQLFSYSSLLTSVQRSQTCALSPERDEQTLWGQLRMFCN